MHGTICELFANVMDKSPPSGSKNNYHNLRLSLSVSLVVPRAIYLR